MQAKPQSVSEYLAQLSEERREIVAAIRAAILENLDAGYAEGIQYGMIGYFVPHSVFPAGYHCDAKQPLPFAAIASQKNYVSLYLMGTYCGGTDKLESADALWFREAWQKTGKKLDMGKSCVRIRKLSDVPLSVVGAAIKRLPADEYVRRYQASLVDGFVKPG